MFRSIRHILTGPLRLMLFFGASTDYASKQAHSIEHTLLGMLFGSASVFHKSSAQSNWTSKRNVCTETHTPQTHIACTGSLPCVLRVLDTQISLFLEDQSTFCGFYFEPMCNRPKWIDLQIRSQSTCCIFRFPQVDYIQQQKNITATTMTVMTTLTKGEKNKMKKKNKKTKFHPNTRNDNKRISKRKHNRIIHPKRFVDSDQ